MIVTQVVVEFGLIIGKQGLEFVRFSASRVLIMRFFRGLVSVEHAPCESMQLGVSWGSSWGRPLPRKKSIRSSVTLL